MNVYQMLVSSESCVCFHRSKLVMRPSDNEIHTRRTEPLTAEEIEAGCTDQVYHESAVNVATSLLDVSSLDGSFFLSDDWNLLEGTITQLEQQAMHRSSNGEYGHNVATAIKDAINEMVK